MIPRLLLFILLSLAACSADRLYSTPDEVPQARVAVAWDSVEVVEVTLPTYAASEAIYVREADGAIAALGPLWSDDPARATTLQLSRDLAAITGARVAPDPWPFRGFAEVRLDVRIEDFVATGPGTFLISGQYFVAPDSGRGDRARRFRIEVPLTAGTAAGIAAARGSAVAQLAEQIAREGLR